MVWGLPTQEAGWCGGSLLGRLDDLGPPDAGGWKMWGLPSREAGRCGASQRERLDDLGSRDSAAGCCHLHPLE
jgi:hypothetical protein